jgi:hypothetical protein
MFFMWVIILSKFMHNLVSEALNRDATVIGLPRGGITVTLR